MPTTDRLASELCITPYVELLPMQKGGLSATSVIIERLKAKSVDEPKPPAQVGKPRFTSWHKSYVMLK